MKIIGDKCAYLQRCYFDILIKSTLVTGDGVPMSMYDVVNKCSFYKMNDVDYIKFSKQEEINFIKSQDWIIDYNIYINMEIDEIKKEIELVDLEGESLNETFSSLNEENRKLEYGYWLTKAMMLGLKRQSLMEILNLKENDKTINLKCNNFIRRLLRR